jgi:hypothetical protein
MHLINDADGWQIVLNQGRVARIEIDFRMSLLIADESSSALLCIETSCCVHSQSGDAIITPAETLSVSAILPLFNADVTSIAIHGTGLLTVYFTDERKLVVGPDEAFEAWQISSPNDFLLICAPGGRIDVF